jgi:hypothetical protein
VRGPRSSLEAVRAYPARASEERGPVANVGVVQSCNRRTLVAS